MHSHPHSNSTTGTSKTPEPNSTTGSTIRNATANTTGNATANTANNTVSNTMGNTSGDTAATSTTKQNSDAAPGTAAAPRRLNHRLRKPTASGVLRVLLPLVGLACAFAIVLTWFPKPVFSMPIQSSDAPGHYYFISKLMHEGLGAAFRLWPNDTFYPPLFHILAYLCSSLVGLLTGTPLSIYASFSVTWILTSGILFPLGMMLLCSYFLRSPLARAIRRGDPADDRSGDSSETGSRNSHNSNSQNTRNTLDTGFRNTPNAPNTPDTPSLNTPHSTHSGTSSKTPPPSHTPHPPSEPLHTPHEPQSATTQGSSLPELPHRPGPDTPAPALPWVRTALLTLTPILAVSSVCHPYTMLDAGPLVSYGFAMSLLPYLLTASLHLLGAINAMLLRHSTTHGGTPHDAPHNTPFNTPPTKQLTPQTDRRGNSAPSLHGNTSITANPGSPTTANPSNPNTTSISNANLTNPNRPNAPSPANLSTSPSSTPSSHPSPSSPHILPPHAPSPHTPLQDTPHPLRAVLAWIAVTAACGAIMLLAHPRALFTYAMLMLPFIILRLPWRFVAAAFGAITAGGAAFVVFMFATFKSERYADPASWFHSHMPSKTLADAILYGLSDGLDGAAGILFALLLLASAAAGIRFAAAGLARRNIIALTVAFAFVVIVYVSTVTLTGALPNMLSAPWYRDENRIVAMLPLTAVPLVVAGVGATLTAAFGGRPGARPVPAVGSGDGDASGRDISSETGRGARVSAPGTPATAAAGVNADGRRRTAAAVRVASAATVALLVAATFAAQVAPRSREATAARIAANASLTAGADPVEQLTEAKVAVLGRVVARTGTAATIVSDPMNGSMYATSMFDATMLYPIMNAQSTGDAWRLGATEEAFASGDGARLLETVCPIGADLPEYFLAMGDQATSLQSFPYKAQYDAFHNTDLIGAYERGGVLVKVADYGSYGKDWALYQFGCGA